jgi:hypothetical protein
VIHRYAHARKELFDRFEHEAHVAKGKVARWLSGVAERFPLITSVILSGTDVADCCIAPLAMRCRHLEHIEVSKSTALIGTCLAELGKGCPQLSSVTLRRCEKLEKEFVNAFAASCPQLKSIQIIECGNVLCVPTVGRCVSCKSYSETHLNFAFKVGPRSAHSLPPLDKDY